MQICESQRHKRKAASAGTGGSRRAKRCRRQLQRVANNASVLLSRRKRPKSQSGIQTSSASGPPSAARAQHDHGPVASALHPVSDPDWTRRPYQHRRASSESCITLEEMAERSRSRPWHVRRRRSSLSLPATHDDRLHLSASATGSCSTCPTSPGIASAIEGHDEPDSDPLPQLSLLSATETAPVGWRRPAARMPPAPAISSYQPEQQRFWPLVDHQLDYTGARMLSAAMSSAAQSALQQQHEGEKMKVSSAAFHDRSRLAGLPFPVDGAAIPATEPDVEGKQRTYGRSLAPTTAAATAAVTTTSNKNNSSNDSGSCSCSCTSSSNGNKPLARRRGSSPLTPGKADGATSHSHLLAPSRIQGDGSAPGSSSGSRHTTLVRRRSGPPTKALGRTSHGPCSPSTTLASILAHTCRQHGESAIRLMARPGPIPADSAASSSESEGERTPRQWRFNTVVTQGREAKRLRSDATPDAELGVRSVAAPPAQAPAPTPAPSWMVQHDYFGNWDAPQKRAV